MVETFASFLSSADFAKTTFFSKYSSRMPVEFQIVLIQNI